MLTVGSRPGRALPEANTPCFLVYTLIGLAAAIAHFWIVRHSHLGTASAMVLGVAGGWNGALVADAIAGGHWAMFGAFSVAGCILGAAGALIGMDVAVEAYLRYDQPLAPGVAHGR